MLKLLPRGFDTAASWPKRTSLVDLMKDFPCGSLHIGEHVKLPEPQDTPASLL